MAKGAPGKPAAGGVAPAQPLFRLRPLLTDENAAQAAETAQPDTAAAPTAAPIAVAEATPDASHATLSEDDEYAAAWAQADAQDAAEAADAAAAEAEPEAEDTATQPLFTDTGLSAPILQAIAEKGYLHPTPIQAQAIPVVLSGRDVMGVAQTGTGKTASFVLPMMDILSGSRARARMPRSLILEPTRELALQVAENFVLYGKHLKLNHALLIGGESMNEQKDALMKGVDVLIATPGRLMDMFERGGLLLTDCRVLVIDEADRMLDMGFIPDVEKIVSFLPATRQTLFFSATMAPEIRRLADAFLTNPKTITVSKSASVATTIVAGLALVAELDKREALRRLIRSEDVQNALIFCNRKRDVDVLYKSLTKHGFSVGALHGDMPQPTRFATLEKFKANEIRLLVCSDVAARGIDIGGLSHVFNFDVPHHAEDYVHRIGRTGRAGREGHAYTLATPEDRLAVEAIEKLTGHAIPRIAVGGLDPVEWSEGDSRKRRGRGGKPTGGRGESRRDTKPPRDEAAPAEARAPREERAPRPPREERTPREERGSREERAPREDRAPREERAPREARPPREDRGPRDRDRARPPRPERAAEAPRHEQPRVETRSAEPFRPMPYNERPRRYRDDDLGPSVTGFGDDIPAFMLLPKRAKRTHVQEHEQDEAA